MDTTVGGGAPGGTRCGGGAVVQERVGRPADLVLHVVLPPPIEGAKRFPWNPPGRLATNSPVLQD